MTTVLLAWLQLHQQSSKLFCDAYFEQAHEAAVLRPKLNAAAIVLQRNWRAFAAFRKKRQRHQMIKLLQRNVRGFLGRRHYIKTAFQRDEAKNRIHYHQHATTIQRVWRGYWVRKSIMNFALRKQYLVQFSKQTDEVRHILRNHKEKQDAEIECTHQALVKAQIISEAARLHPLLSTSRRAGPLRSPSSTFSEMPRSSISTRRASVSPTSEARRSSSIHSSLGTMPRRESVSKEPKAVPALTETVGLTEEEVNDINLNAIRAQIRQRRMSVTRRVSVVDTLPPPSSSRPTSPNRAEATVSVNSLQGLYTTGVHSGSDATHDLRRRSSIMEANMVMNLPAIAILEDQDEDTLLPSLVQQLVITE